MVERHQEYTERELAEMVLDEEWPRPYDIVVQGNAGLRDAIHIYDWSQVVLDEEDADRTYVFDGESADGLEFTEVLDTGYRRSDGEESLTFYDVERYEKLLAGRELKNEGRT